jgi:hypothetical protein
VLDSSSAETVSSYPSDPSALLNCHAVTRSLDIVGVELDSLRISRREEHPSPSPTCSMEPHLLRLYDYSAERRLEDDTVRVEFDE